MIYNRREALRDRFLDKSSRDSAMSSSVALTSRGFRGVQKEEGYL